MGTVYLCKQSRAVYSLIHPTVLTGFVKSSFPSQNCTNFPLTGSYPHVL